MDKLAQCIKMLEVLKKENIKFLYTAGNQGELPIDNAEMRYYPEFTLCANGSVEYHGTDGKDKLNSYYSNSYYGGRNDVRLKNLKPTPALIDFAYTKLKKICMEQAREQVMQRLVEHQVKITGLDFLLQTDEVNLH